MNEPLGIVFQRRATREVERIDEWWRANRRAAPDLFITELGRMLSAVAILPTLGAPSMSDRIAGVRRVLPPKTRYHVYYRIRGGSLQVLAVWHARRRAGPRV
jgi:plasmid stabilization system protein ParE